MVHFRSLSFLIAGEWMCCCCSRGDFMMLSCPTPGSLSWTPPSPNAPPPGSFPSLSKPLLSSLDSIPSSQLPKQQINENHIPLKIAVLTCGDKSDVHVGEFFLNIMGKSRLSARSQVNWTSIITVYSVYNPHVLIHPAIFFCVIGPKLAAVGLSRTSSSVAKFMAASVDRKPL